MLTVNLGPRSYPIAVVSDDLAGLGELANVRARGRRAVLIHDPNVLRWASAVREALQSAGWFVAMLEIPAGEESKSIPMALALYERCAALPVDRSTAIVAVGGGVVGDLAGFVAATYNRGLPLIMVPTSLLAMVDSSVGGKVGVNLHAGKNLVGAFHQPLAVWIDTATLDTLPPREYRSGLAEVVKYGVILDPDFFAWLETQAQAILNRDPQVLRHLVQRSCELKARVVEQDEREETGARMILNYGHTFAHAYETRGGYGFWLHGEAVAAGMIAASRLAEKLGRIPTDVTRRQQQLLATFGLPTEPRPEWSRADLLAIMRRDKKAEAGQLRFVLPKTLGQVEVVTVDECWID